MNQFLHEYYHIPEQGVQIDTEKGILHGVKILGLISKNGRRYMPEALREAVILYEGAKVNVNHPKGHPESVRDYQDRIGEIRNVHFLEGKGLYADFFFNPCHALASQLIWDAQNAPHNVGFSHNVTAQTVQKKDFLLVEHITQVKSVDLVADPATTSGLYETFSDNSGQSQNSLSVSSLSEESDLSDESSDGQHEMKPYSDHHSYSAKLCARTDNVITDPVKETESVNNTISDDGAVKPGEKDNKGLNENVEADSGLTTQVADLKEELSEQLAVLRDEIKAVIREALLKIISRSPVSYESHPFHQEIDSLENFLIEIKKDGGEKRFKM